MVKRKQERDITEALSDTPIVMIVGPRQCGKSTIANSVSAGRTMVTFDDPRSMAAAKLNPVEFLKSLDGPATIDEVQRVPEIFLPLKAEIDRDRTPGRFLLTGSANVLHMPKIGDSLAGRMEVVNLLPFSQGELEGAADRFVDALFEKDFKVSDQERDPDLYPRMTIGGFPEPAQRKTPERRRAWFDSYVKTILDRDIRDIANIDAISQMPRLFSLIAARSGSILNANSLAAELQIPYTSLKRYIDLLEVIFLIHKVPAWSTNYRGRIVTKSPKLYLVDTGLLCSLANYDLRYFEGQPLRQAPVMENFVAMELKKQCNFGRVRPWLMHFKTVRNLEVDFVLETKDQKIAGVEVRTTRSLRNEDADGLRYLQEVAPEQFVRGVVLYHGSEVVKFSKDIYGVPIQFLWDMQHS